MLEKSMSIAENPVGISKNPLESLKILSKCRKCMLGKSRLIAENQGGKAKNPPRPPKIQVVSSLIHVESRWNPVESMWNPGQIQVESKWNPVQIHMDFYNRVIYMYFPL